MKMIKKLIHKFKIILLYIGIYILLGISNRLIKILQYKQLINLLTNAKHNNEYIIEGNLRRKLRVISDAIERVSIITPWRSMCFEQAVTTAIILRIWGVSYTIFFGIKRDNGGGLLAHAWTKAGNLYITGYKNMESFQVLYITSYIPE